MSLLALPGSVRPGSTNLRWLRALQQLSASPLHIAAEVSELPLFRAGLSADASVQQWREQVANADAVIICTPEYLHNLPAMVKNALEWLTTGGELRHKPVLAMTATPAAPRGDRAMQSLLWTLDALEARVVAQLPIYDVPSLLDDAGEITDADTKEMMQAALAMLTG